MSIVTTKELACDTCQRIEDFGLMYGRTARELFAAAEKAGWKHNRELREIRRGGWMVVDTCPACAVA